MDLVTLVKPSIFSFLILKPQHRNYNIGRPFELILQNISYNIYTLPQNNHKNANREMVA